MDSGFLIFLRAFNATPLLPGIDGPYYAVQVNWILKYGGLKYLDPPLTFYSKLVLLTLFTSLLLATNHYIFTGFRPSIPLEEYNELVNVVQKYNGKSFVVPDTCLR
ncbi:MAG: hypothetical protein J7L38_03535, partial [Thermoproteales archaeon]|nr:hypothetical protein [Thermoproteales archaeon]